MRKLYIELDKTNELNENIEDLKVLFNKSTTADLIRHLVNNHKNLLKNNLESEIHLYRILYSDNSTALKRMTKPEMIDYKKSIHYRNFTTEDLTVKHIQRI